MQEKENAWDYLREGMSGLEAYRAMELCLERWYNLTKNEYVEFLYTSLQSNQGMMSDFADSVRDMLIEREKFGNKNLAGCITDMPVYKPCECQKNNINNVSK